MRHSLTPGIQPRVLTVTSLRFRASSVTGFTIADVAAPSSRDPQN
jgi:hypothetical protein